jgi:hypothetical protein
MTVAVFTCPTTIYFKTESLFIHRLIQILFQLINIYGEIPVLFESIKCNTETHQFYMIPARNHRQKNVNKE